MGAENLGYQSLSPNLIALWAGDLARAATEGLRMTLYNKDNLLPVLVAEGITLKETQKQIETALSILRNEEKILVEAQTRLERDEQLLASRNKQRNRNRLGGARNNMVARR